jgi:hypothetical protein
VPGILAGLEEKVTENIICIFKLIFIYDIMAKIDFKKLIFDRVVLFLF